MKKLIFICFYSVIILLFVYCANNDSKVSNNYKESPYASLRDSVAYVGMNTCITCHNNIHQTFMHTGMGESFGVATRSKSKANFDSHSIVYDSKKDFYYHPYWKNDSLWIKEYRLNSKRDTIYSREEKISYIVGSGQHTNSHIWKSNGYLYQAPITFYTQKQIWDLAPGFEDGLNARWTRIISTECMNCHNMYPEYDFSAENKFISVKKGIECERCHGPGKSHVDSKMRGEIVDTSKYIDYTIVNPKKLSRDLQMELCQRCHLQGISVLNENKTYFDFKPGMYMSDVMNVFMPRYQGTQTKFIMASHADRLKQSKCYMKSEMTCLSCHNPHISVKETSNSIFNSKCQSCHTNTNDCKERIEARKLNSDNCFECHMPVSETLDIPHVTVHDHRIHIPSKDKLPLENDMKFIGLECMTQKTPSALLMAQGYLTTYESFDSKSFLLDSALTYLNRIKVDNEELKKIKIRYYYLKQDFRSLILISKSLSNQTNLDAWSNYRIGEAYYEVENYNVALTYLSKAVDLMPEQLDFLNQVAKTHVMLKDYQKSQSVFEKILSLNPQYEKAYSNLAFLYMLKNDAVYAQVLINKALALNPDLEDALMNQAALYIGLKNYSEAKKILVRVMRLYPLNKKASFALQKINNS
jgi:hypothetical protein